MDVSGWFGIQQFLFQEARFLDEYRFEEWLDCFTEDATYVMPGRRNPWRSLTYSDTINRADELAIFEDNKSSLCLRIARLRTGLAWAEDPPSRTRRLVSNVEVISETTDDCLVKSNFIIYRSQQEYTKDIFVGTRDDRLVRHAGSWQIRSRTILLEDAVHDTGSLSILF